jgi:hypothetical protein
VACSAEFDAAVCFGALGHILPQDERLFLRIIHRALKPGGKFVFVSGPHPPPLSTPSIVLRSFNGIMRVRNFLLKPPFIMYYLSFLLPEVREMLIDEGFTVSVHHGVLPAPFSKYSVVVAQTSRTDAKEQSLKP